MKNDWVREKFSIFEQKTYINSCSYGALSTEVKQAFNDYLLDRDQDGALWPRWCELLEDLRSEVAGLLNASPDEIAITGSASNGVNSVASALDFTGSRNKIVTTDFEFPSVAQIWHAQEMQGATIHSVAARGGTIPRINFEQALDEQTQLVSLSQVCYRNGAAIDVNMIRDMARDRGAMVMLDSFQMIGTQSVDVKALDVDFLVGGFLKYLLGTAGVAFLYVKKDLLPGLNPTATGWFAQKDIHAMDIRANKPSDTARKFETGTPPVVNIYAALAANEALLR
ncbi:MAG: aminotransferase class V-fold PLP-dependent enzyme [Emcibacter sp.]|nr:aminotransferase class V-fold PLP-dependent enzyme [Emcibacter sp.]